ncbi:MAG: hypothetical protein J5365_07610 [Erysipelotrichaceae bacterium]|nr:hypothetical protein [Erysipelotrichaceae bacterium]
MLGKLIKYDFKAMFRSLCPIYVALIALTIVFSLMVKFNFDQGLLFSIFAFLFVAALNGSIIASVILVVTRFSNGLLKNEGYLSFALPVSTAKHILAKVINAIIWAFIEGLMLCVCLLIMGAVMGSIKEVAYFFHEVFQALGVVEKEVLVTVLQIVAFLILEMISSVCLIYAATAVGHLFSRNQKLVAVAFLIVVCVLRSFLWVGLVNLSERFTAPAHVFTDDLILIIPPIIFAAVYAFITWFILDRKLNLE